MISSTMRSGGRVLPLLPLVLFALCGSLRAQTPLGADAVERFTPGSGYGANYGSDYFPTNVLGLPDSAARPTIPTVDPSQILGLGFGGEIVLRFDAAPILDRPGPDIAVFENAFRYTLGSYQRIYAEPAEVSVSRDGVEWMAFPFDTLTLVGCAGVTPTDGSYPLLNPLSGGDRFDLAQLGVDSVRYVRLRDVSAIPRSDTSHPFYDYTLNGFDLDAVVNLSNGVAPAGVAAGASLTACSLAPSLSNGRTTLRLTLPEPGRVRCTLFDLAGGAGERVFDGLLPAGSHALPLVARTTGTYLLRVEREGGAPVTLRWTVVR